MMSSLRRIAVPAMFAGLLGVIVPTNAGAEGPPDGFRIKDGAGFFSKEAMDKAEKVIAKMKREVKQDLLIETYAEIPDGVRAKYQEEKKASFFKGWARERYDQARVSGVLILICKDPTYIFTEEGKETGKRAFTAENARAVSDLLAKHFKERDFDGGLLAAVEYVEATERRHLAKGATSGASSTITRTTQELQKEVSTMSPAGWICIGLGVLLALWVVVGLFRAMSGGGQSGRYAQGGPAQSNFGPGGPPPGYIPPPGGGYGGGGYAAPAGGGGGFFKGMLGGMLGGAAGAWAYDRFFRGDSGSGGFGGPSITPPAYGGSAPPDNSAGGGAGADWGSSGDTTDTGTGGGADWSGGGGDTGGGADWSGGGGDTGGGADWGGGGGDTGGGADWGGGGGDDSGGGSDW